MGSAIFISTPISRICITDTIVRECWAASPYLLLIENKILPGFVRPVPSSLPMVCSSLVIDIRTRLISLYAGLKTRQVPFLMGI